MSDEQVYVSHAPTDVEAVQTVFSTLRNLPVGVHVASEEVETGRPRGDLKGRLANSDVVVCVLTEAGAESPWVQQEVGFAVARGIPVLPMYEPGVRPDGYIERQDGIEFDPDERETTVFNLLCRLRSVLAPLGTLSTPNWFVRFPCNFGDCGHPVTLDVEATQKTLWQQYKHRQPLVASCDECGSRYFFNPATLGFVEREDGTQSEN
ncbi:toll/interleukin-1 receptor domain-containing protein [Haloarchaeobius sp. TZWWS8]|uniref:toll/interleukin-1 receptor domain-containing protein n=1 Tax=Haloarchaeobius sp. TZWWS8 TaxID=3446121 RepID=UPI003EBA5BBB